MRTGLLQAGPLAAAGVLANGANVVVTVALARLAHPHGYGVLNQLTGLFLILSMPGSAVVVAVVRRVTMWHEDGSGHLVRRWAGRVHRQGSLVVAGLGASRLRQPALDRRAARAAQRDRHRRHPHRGRPSSSCSRSTAGLLQARRAYRPLAANLLVEGGMRTVAVLALVAARGRAPRGRRSGFMIGRGGGRRPRPLRWPCGPGPTDAAPAGPRPPGRLAVGPAGWVAAVRPDPELGGPGWPGAPGGAWTWWSPRISLSMVAVLQNVDVLIVGRDNPRHSGAYAAVSVTSKAIVFGAIVLGGYLLPEAAIRWRQGGHALRQLGVVLVLLAVPAASCWRWRSARPTCLLEVVFHHAYTSAAVGAGAAGGGHDPAEYHGHPDHVPAGRSAGGGWPASWRPARWRWPWPCSAVHGRPQATALVDLGCRPSCWR